MLVRLGIRQKVALLLAIPLAAVLLVMVPYVADRASDARSAADTARIALAAREIGSLIQTLQQERLLALGYLSAPSLDRSALVTQTQDAIDDAAQLRADPVTAPVLAKAAHELNELTVVRQGVVSRSTLPLTVYAAYRNANTALLDALGLIRTPGTDAQGLSQLSALEALMRSNEEASSVGAVLVAAAADASLSRSLLTEAVIAEQQYLQRFRQLVPADQSALVDSVENGQAGQRIRQIILIVDQNDGPAKAEVSGALTAAVTYAGLRRLAQDRVARDIATTAQSRANTAQAIVFGVAGGGVALLVIVVIVGVTVGRSIARPLRRLTRAAAVVAELSRAELVRVADSDRSDPGPPQLTAVDVESADEIGELATAINRVQATAALLLERQVTARGNVATMFANIARRTQNLAGRQLALIDDLERSERSPEGLQRIQRLDHVATRLRRSADSLLVMSGTIDQVMSANPTPLADVISSALNEIEGANAVDTGPIATIAVSANLVGDLRLLLAELLENATNFSPPGSPVEVSATVGEECRIVIVDYGVGLGPARLQEENRRLVERERLDVAPTTVLGLFVVGRLARRHGLTVQLGHSPGRGITATVRIPVRLLSTTSKVMAIPAQRRPRRAVAALPAMPTSVGASLAAVSRLAIDVAAIASGESFGWFDPRSVRAVAEVGPPRHAVGDPPAPPRPARPPSAPPQTASGLPARPAPPPASSAPAVPHPAARNAATAHPAAGSAAVRNPAARNSSGPAPAPAPSTDPRTGLARRVPGTHMVGKVREQLESPTERIARNPEAERDALNDYLSGLNRTSGETGANHAERPL